MATPVLVNGATGVLATAINVRGQACQVLGYHIHNPSNAAAFVQFFDSTAPPTVGTTVPVWSCGLATLTSTAFNIPAGLYFNLGLYVAATTTIGGNGAPSAALSVNLAMS